MAGYICKIVIEDTHPPVWRRVVIPDRITFEELHELIQVLFDWEDWHLHEFQIPSDRIMIGQEETWGEYYNEQETLIDPFFRNYKWIRYIYDFGDNWKHKINIEKADMDYESRMARLLKFKGDNFEEDCGGTWWASEKDYRRFKQDEVEKKLGRMVFSRHDELQETKLLKENMKEFGELFEKLLTMKPEVVQSQLAKAVEDVYGDISPMALKIEKWKEFEETESVKTLRLVSPKKSQEQILMDLGVKEAADYYKYLRIPRNRLLSQKEEVEAISETLRQHPEYLLYIFDENEYRELVEWMQYSPFQSISGRPENKGMMLKALGMGIVDLTDGESEWELSFATDINCYVGCVDAKTRKSIYRTLSRFDERMGGLILLYGMIELESLYEIYKNLYETNLEAETFYRYLYWHARFNDFINTVYRMDGVCYVASKELDVQSVMEKMGVYAEELSYAVYSRQEIEHKGKGLQNRSEWVDVLVAAFHYQLGMELQESQMWLIQVVCFIINGDTLNQIMEILTTQEFEGWSVEAAADMWNIISGLMLDLELPMLKGRNRIRYAEEQKVSPWSIGMVSDCGDDFRSRTCRMYQFPAEIQERMLEAINYGVGEKMKQLWDYKEQNGICSEEYMYLLAEACITFGHTDLAEKIIVQLKKSSPAGKKTAKGLEHRLLERYEVMDEEDDFWDLYDEGWMEQEEVQKPYVRDTPKVGRNDMCPCGSGKKYKKCCGK